MNDKRTYTTFMALLLSMGVYTDIYAASFPFGQPTYPGQPIVNPNTLRVINQCSYPIWVHTEGRINGEFQQNETKVDHASALDYTIPPTGARATLTKAYSGCNAAGKQCAIGSDDVDTRFEVDWYSTMKGKMIVPNLSVVEGYTFPVKVDYVENGKKKTQDCGKLSLLQCPADFYDYKNGGPFDQRVLNSGQIVGCYPNKKISTKSSHYNQFVQNNDYQYYGCPTPPISVGMCRINYGSDPNDSRIISDKTPAFVQYLHNYGKYQGLLDNSCKIYGYAYDDTFGTPSSDADQPVILTYCPDPNNEPVLPIH